MRLYLVRHPKPQVASGVCYGSTDVVCKGEELESAAIELLSVLPKSVEMISSPLSRCEQLAQVLCRREADYSYKTDQKLTEMHFGAWEMLPWGQISPHELSAWTDAFASYRCGGTGESTALLLQRVAQRLHASAVQGDDQIWITHAGVIRAMQWLGQQPYAVLASLVEPIDPALNLCLPAADWPRGEVAFGRVCQGQPWNWPANWPAVWQQPSEAA
ncbi:MAG: phosphoglycerate kinase [Burkholderiales bacterium]|nr:MAG: phosphoglycerate kinase [Burkholderiales bacterium]